MSKHQPSQHAISGVFVFLLMGVFAVFSTVMVLLGARTYKSTSDRTQQHNESRVAAAYVRSMVRADDEKDEVLTENLNGIPTVTMIEVYDGDEYVTRLYAYEGTLRELFTERANEFEPDLGEPICPLEEMNAEIRGGLMTIHLKSADAETDVQIALRCAADGGVKE